MVWNEFFEQWASTWAAFGGVMLIGFKSFVLDPIRNRKTQFDLTSFKSIQVSVKDEIKAYTKIMVDSFAEFKGEVVNPLIAELKQKDYQQAIMSDILITMLSASNVPLANKEQAFKSLSQLDGMNKELLARVSANIEAQKLELKQVSTVQEAVYDNLNKGV